MLLIDAGMVAFAAWHALKGRVRRPLTLQVPRSVRKRIDEQPDAFLLFWNGPTLRKRQALDTYRDRPEIWEHAGDEDFEGMIDLLRALGAVQYRTDGWEADEILAAVCTRLPGPKVLWSDDKDFFQLLDDETHMEGRVRGTVRAEDVTGILGVPPALVADFLALAGDRVDGIPRIVGPRTGARVLREFGPITGWLDRRPEAMPDATHAFYGERRAQILANLELTDLRSCGDPPAPLLGDGWCDLERAAAVAEAAGHRRLAAEIDRYQGLADWGKRTVDLLAQAGLL